MMKTYALCLAIVLAALVVIVGPDARKAYYQSQCEKTGGTSLWLANSSDDQRHDGLTKPYCRGVDGTDRAM